MKLYVFEVMAESGQPLQRLHGTLSSRNWILFFNRVEIGHVTPRYPGTTVARSLLSGGVEAWSSHFKKNYLT